MAEEFDAEADEKARKKASLKKAPVGFWLDARHWVDIPRMPIDAADLPIPGWVALPGGQLRYIVEKGTPHGEDI